MTVAAGTRKPAAIRRAEIAHAADAEFAAHGLAGTRLEAIAGRVGISHPRIVQMFGTKRDLFLDVVDRAFDKVEAEFAAADTTFIALGTAYGRVLRREPTIGLVILQAYAAASDPEVRETVRRRHLQLLRRVQALTGADASQVRTFFATGLVTTVSTVLELPGRRADAAWSTWILGLAEDTRTQADGQPQ